MRTINQPQQTQDFYLGETFYRIKTLARSFLIRDSFNMRRYNQALIKQGIIIQNPNQGGYHNHKRRTSSKEHQLQQDEGEALQLKKTLKHKCTIPRIKCTNIYLKSQSPREECRTFLETLNQVHKRYQEKVMSEQGEVMFLVSFLQSSFNAFLNLPGST